tara:strand:+ start:1887 stop:3134 length:1248 start_codon:yes stop_codon:yes gene_type:complete
MPINGSIILPGDKSLSHRSLMIGALSNGMSVINNISTGEDVESTRRCLIECGIFSEKIKSKVEIHGGKFSEPNNILNCGNSGTTLRLLMGLLAGQGISAKFIGDKSLSARPMNRVLVPLEEMGVSFNSNDGYLPITMNVPEQLNAISYNMSIASAQVKSSIIFASLGAMGDTSIYEEIKTRDHTEIMLSNLGVDIKTNKKIKIKENKRSIKNFNMTIPGDPSSASFFAALTAMIPNSNLTIKNILANPTRTGFFTILKKMGTDIKWENMRVECGELIGDVCINSQPLCGIDIDSEMVPSIIDEIPIISILATQADSPTNVSGASELRVKESDRIKAICINLSNMGCEIIEKKDGFIINPVKKLYSTSINSFNDHRIAMSFMIANNIIDGENIIDNTNCINISFPEFEDILKTIVK